MTDQHRPLEAFMDPTWAQALAPVTEDIHRLGDIVMDRQRAGAQILPDGPNILRAFSRPIDQVHVLVVGQDPYPTPGHPIGLSFSTQRSVRPLPRSLVNIYTELQSDLGIAPC